MNWKKGLAVHVFILQLSIAAASEIFLERRKLTENEAIMLLDQLGYIAQGTANGLGDSYEASLKAAIIRFQKRFGLEKTGDFSYETLQFMRGDRCGNADYTVQKYESAARRHKRYIAFEDHHLSNFTVLKWKIKQKCSSLSLAQMESAFETATRNWMGATSQIRFKKVAADDFKTDIDVNILCVANGVDLGDNVPLYEGITGHAYYPNAEEDESSMDVHINDGYTWSYGLLHSEGDSFDLINEATHQLGHVLGLMHSMESNVIMTPYYNKRNQPESPSQSYLMSDDIAGIQALYGDVKDYADFCYYEDENAVDAALTDAIGSRYFFKGNKIIQVNDEGFVEGSMQLLSVNGKELSGIHAAIYIPSVSQCVYRKGKFRCNNRNAKAGGYYLFADEYVYVSETNIPFPQALKERFDKVEINKLEWFRGYTVPPTGIDSAFSPEPSQNQPRRIYITHDDNVYSHAMNVVDRTKTYDRSQTSKLPFPVDAAIVADKDDVYLFADGNVYKSDVLGEISESSGVNTWFKQCN